MGGIFCYVPKLETNAPLSLVVLTDSFVPEQLETCMQIVTKIVHNFTTAWPLSRQSINDFFG